MSETQPGAAGAWNATAAVAAGPAEGVSYAGFWIRAIAWIIDAIALGILTSALAPAFGTGPIIGVADGRQFQIDYAANAIGGLIGLVYWVGLWSWKGQTLGMMPFGLWVVRVDNGERVDVVTGFLRYVGLIISFVVILLGVIWVAFDSRKQGWHDKLAKTLVVRR